MRRAKASPSPRPEARPLRVSNSRRRGFRARRPLTLSGPIFRTRPTGRGPGLVIRTRSRKHCTLTTSALGPTKPWEASYRRTTAAAPSVGAFPIRNGDRLRCATALTISSAHRRFASRNSPVAECGCHRQQASDATRPEWRGRARLGPRCVGLCPFPECGRKGSFRRSATLST